MPGRLSRLVPVFLAILILAGCGGPSVRLMPGDEVQQLLIQQAQEIIDALIGTVRPHGIQFKSKNANGHATIEFVGDVNCAYILEASTNLVNWTPIGMATPCGDGEFMFEDSDSNKFSTRYYRVVAP